MAAPVIMPRQGQSVESCIIGKWYKQKGDKVEIGDLLFSYETDKASFEEEAKVSGTFLGSFFAEGDDVPCLINVCVIGNEGEDIQEFNPNASSANETKAEVKAEVKEDPAKAQTQNENQTEQSASIVMNDSNEIKISPRAKNLADRNGIDYRYAIPTGPYGRIIERDVTALKEAGIAFTASARDENMKGEAGGGITGTGLGGRITTSDLASGAVKEEAIQTFVTAASPAAANEPMYDEAKISNMRKIIAKAMQNSLSSMAQLTLNSSFDATEILEFRKKLKESKDKLGLENITLNDIILYAVSRTLMNFKDLNANLVDDRMLYFRNVNLGMAVDTERGLMVPTIMNANQKSLNDISKEAKKLAKECQAGSINPDLIKNGSFTVTNLGSLGIESFTPVINPPQTGILGVNNIVQKAREVGDEIEFYPAMGLSLTFDHKALDGAYAAKFLQELSRNLESFSTLLVK